MAFCSHCGNSHLAAATFCHKCGNRLLAGAVTIATEERGLLSARTAGGSVTSTAPAAPPRGGVGFIQTFGLDIRVAILAVIVDTLVFGGTIVTFGALYFFEVAAGVVLGYITYKIQSNWYGDDHNAALIKGLVIGLVTAIPAPITWLFAVPGGTLGFLHMFRRK